MRLLAVADLHYNNARSRRLADELIDQLHHAGGDAVVLVGDTSVADGPWLEACLDRIRFPLRLFVCGNHELWTAGENSYRLFRHELPRRVREAGWHWLEDEPLVLGSLAIVGTIGWYDYSFAAQHLGIPRRFYQAKVSPGVAAAREELAHLRPEADDVSDAARRIFARWNDGRFVKLGRSDEAFLDELLGRLGGQLASLSAMKHIVAAVHHVPFAELLPPARFSQWDFAWAFLGSGRIGRTLSGFPNVRHVVCGHSHWPAEATIGPIRAINIGSGYRWKTFASLDLPG
jgi:Icc-related predicted phosphoesterase